MKRLIGVFLNNKGTASVDVSHLQDGNPGMGGTQFEFFILLNELSKCDDYDIIYFGTAKQIGLDNVKTIVVKDIYEAFEQCNLLGVDILISRDGGADKLDVLKKTKVIYWVHNFVPYDFCKTVGKNEKVKRVVFVSYQHRDFYLEMNIAKKADVVFNSFYLPEKIEPLKEKDNTVVFIGNIVPIKKLHVITEIWPKVVKKIPNAKLVVIGNGKTANREKTLGPHQIAEKSYEDLLLKPLIKNNILNTVEFVGVLGGEKSDIIKKAKVAVAPNDKETFCISALEYILSGVPVVGVSKGGINDVVQNGKTGALYKTKNGIAKGIIQTLNGRKTFKNLPSGINYLKANFDVGVFIDNWKRIINEVDNDIEPRKIHSRRPYGDKCKYIGLLFKLFRTIFHLPDGFSRVGIASKISRWKNHG